MASIHWTNTIEKLAQKVSYMYSVLFHNTFKCVGSLVAHRNASDFSQSLSAVSLGKAQDTRKFYVTKTELCVSANLGRLHYAQDFYLISSNIKKKHALNICRSSNNKNVTTHRNLHTIICRFM